MMWTARRVKFRRLGWWIPPILWMVFIYYLSAQSDLDAIAPFSFAGADKVAHFALYFVLGLLLARATAPFSGKPSGKKTGWPAFGLGAAYGIIDEIHQAFVPRRAPELLDAVIDICAVAAGVVIYLLFLTRRPRLS
jgi:hypothetical protein